MTEITTEQNIPFKFGVTDGKGRPVAVDGVPKASSSDDTVATVKDELTLADDGKTWDGMVVSVAEGECRIAVTADTDMTPEGVSDCIGIGDITVTLDPATGQRIAQLVFGAPVTKPTE